MLATLDADILDYGANRNKEVHHEFVAEFDR
jgi:hypothetical protein